MTPPTGRTDLTAFRDDPFVLTARINGNSLDGAVLALAIGLLPGVRIAPPVTIGMTAVKGGEGIRIVATGLDADGFPFADIEIVVAKATMQALPAPIEPGLPAVLAYELQWTLADDDSGFSAAERTVMLGKFIVEGSINA